MTTTAPVVTATQVYRVYIKATADAIWTAITDPEWTNRYGYTGYTHYELGASASSYPTAVMARRYTPRLGVREE